MEPHLRLPLGLAPLHLHLQRHHRSFARGDGFCIVPVCAISLPPPQGFQGCKYIRCYFMSPFENRLSTRMALLRVAVHIYAWGASKLSTYKC